MPSLSRFLERRPPGHWLLFLLAANRVTSVALLAAGLTMLGSAGAGLGPLGQLSSVLRSS
jgi:hypothetical protein